MKTRYVYLGRFAPFHNGHKLLLSNMVNKYGLDNVLIIIGSTNTLNQRTPYTYEDRKEIIKVSFPNIEILPLPDGKPNLEYFDGTTNETWLRNIEDIAEQRNEKFVFCGGSELDLEVLAEKFETSILVSREIMKLSATEVREAIMQNDTEKLKKIVDHKAIGIITKKIKKFI